MRRIAWDSAAARRRDVEAEWRPVPVIDRSAEVSWDDRHVLRFSVANVGRGPALACHVEMVLGWSRPDFGSPATAGKTIPTEKSALFEKICRPDADNSGIAVFLTCFDIVGRRHRTFVSLQLRGYEGRRMAPVVTGEVVSEEPTYNPVRRVSRDLRNRFGAWRLALHARRDMERLSCPRSSSSAWPTVRCRRRASACGSRLTLGRLLRMIVLCP
jgi:hypothetical protein